MEMISDMYDCSSALVEELSSKDSNLHKDLITKYLENRLSEKGNKIPSDFEPGLDWLNVNKALSFKEELKGKVVILDFFTYCCINCMHILPQLKTLEHEFSVEDGLVIIGVHSPKFPNEHSTENVKSAVERYEISHPVVNDHEENLWMALGICCWPTLVVIGPNGELLLFLMGESHERILNLFVKETLSVLKMKNMISSHLIPGIGISNEFKENRDLLFPGKVCSTKTASGNILAIADTGHDRILVVDNNGNVLKIIGGNGNGFKDGTFEEAKFHAPQGLVFYNPTTIYVADTENHAIRKIDLESGFVNTVVGDGTQGDDMVGGRLGTEQKISSPWDLEIHKPNVLLVAMAGCHQIWAYFIHDTLFWKNKQYAAGTCCAIVGSGQEENRNNTYPQRAGLAQPSGLAVAESKETVYVADSESSTVRAVSLTNGAVKSVVGGAADPQNLFVFGDIDGCGLDAKLQHPLGVTWSDYKQSLYVCDSYNHKVKVINPLTRYCSTLLNNSLTLNEPGGLCTIDNLLYVADTNNHCVKVINLDDNSVQTMSLTFKRKDDKQKVMEPVKETETILNTKGGVLELILSIEVSANVKPLPDSPAVWSLALPDGWKEIKTEEESLRKMWKIEVPPSLPEERHHLKPHCRLFYCHNNLCSANNLAFLIIVNYENSAPSAVTCAVKHMFSL